MSLGSPDHWDSADFSKICWPCLAAVLQTEANNKHSNACHLLTALQHWPLLCNMIQAVITTQQFSQVFLSYASADKVILLIFQMLGLDRILTICQGSHSTTLNERFGLCCNGKNTISLAKSWAPLPIIHQVIAEGRTWCSCTHVNVLGIIKYLVVTPDFVTAASFHAFYSNKVHSQAVITGL